MQQFSATASSPTTAATSMSSSKWENDCRERARLHQPHKIFQFYTSKFRTSSFYCIEVTHAPRQIEFKCSWSSPYSIYFMAYFVIWNSISKLGDPGALLLQWPIPYVGCFLCDERRRQVQQRCNKEVRDARELGLNRFPGFWLYQTKVKFWNILERSEMQYGGVKFEIRVPLIFKYKSIIFTRNLLMEKGRIYDACAKCD